MGTTVTELFSGYNSNWITALAILFILLAFSIAYLWFWKIGRKIRRRVYLVSDCHFDHTNIIKYCKRPFPNVKVMNRVLVSNWNSVVKPGDVVYFLGDWSFGRRAKPPRFWMKQVKGQKMCIKGSHDRNVKAPKTRKLNYGWNRFLLIHNPDEKPKTWKGWVIHGHKHNNRVSKYPFINGKTKTINVSVELINYTSLNINDLLSLDINSIKRMDTINSNPERWW